MPRIQPIGHAPFAFPYEVFAPSPQELAQVDFAPWHVTGEFEAVENQNALIDEDYFWYDKPPVQNLSSSLTIENALLQRNLLLQCGVGYEHVGMLVVYGQYSAKGASLQAVMPAVWASAEYARLIEHRRLAGASSAGWSAHHHHGLDGPGIDVPRAPGAVDMRA